MILFASSTFHGTVKFVRRFIVTRYYVHLLLLVMGVSMDFLDGIV
jgi:hypothetical protein